MKKSKEKLEILYKEQKNYINYLVYRFLVANPTFAHLREDWESEMALRFIRIVDKFDPERGVKFSTFLYDQINFYLLKALAKEAKQTMMVSTVISMAKGMTAGKIKIPFDEESEESDVEPKWISASRMHYIDTSLLVSMDDPYDTDNFEDILTEGECTGNQKEILRMRFILGMTEKEIGEDLDTSQQAVHNTIQRALKRLRDRIDE